MERTRVTKKPLSDKDYGYSNARLRGMRARLLDQPFYEELMSSTDLSHMILLLQERTEYSHDLEEALIRGQTAAQVDEALRNNMVSTFRRVLNFMSGEGAFLLTTLQGSWDLFNLKTVIRGKHLQMAPDDISANLMQAGRISRVELGELGRLEDVRAVVDTLATWGLPYAHALTRALPEYLEDNDLSVLELAVDRQYAEWAIGRLDEGRDNYQRARDVLATQIDTINLMTAMRLQNADVEDAAVGRFFLKGGRRVPEALFRKVAGLSDIDDVIDAMKGTPYHEALEGAAVRYVEVGSVSVFERALEDYLTRRALSASLGDPLGIGVAINYLWAKQNEVTNLRIVVKGHAVGMPPDRVRKELILV